MSAIVSDLVTALHKYPEIAIYLTIAVGFWVGSINMGRFNLGTVTCTLLAGLAIGQFQFHIPEVVQSTFFAMFLFSVGYAVGPQFIRALRSDGLPQVVFSILVCISGLGTAILLGKVLGYNSALTAGLLSGGYTNSTVLGVASDTISQMGMDPTATKAALALMPVAYAVTYPFGTVGSAWLLASGAPKLLGFNLPRVCRDYEREHGSIGNTGTTTAYHQFYARSYRLGNHDFVGLTVGELERYFNHLVFIRRLRDGDRIIECEKDTILPAHAVITVSGTLETLVDIAERIGEEVKDIEMVDFSTEKLDVVVTNRSYADRTLSSLLQDVFGEPGRGVFLCNFTRGDAAMPLDPNLKIHRGDVLTILGPKSDVAKVARMLGYADRPLEKSDMAFMSFGIVLGSLLGAITIHVAGIPLSFGTSVGAIVAGIVCGYLRSTKRTFGRIPGPAIWVFNNVGLNGFIAVIGLNAAPGFIDGLQHYGLALFLAGVVVTIIPLLVGLILGHFVFRFHPGITLGVTAGARSTTAALGALQEASQSQVPVLGYTIGYATSRIVMAIFAIVLVNVF